MKASKKIILRSDRLVLSGFIHGFSTRKGGVSHPPFDSLNLGLGIGDQEVFVKNNRAMFFKALAVKSEEVFEVSQVHGNRVVVLEDEDEPVHIRKTEADALITPFPNQTIAVRTADCVPILCADPETGVVAAIHAGWRGCVAGIVCKTFEILKKDFKISPSVIAAVGPHISKTSFEIGPEIISDLENCSSAKNVIATRGGKTYADLTSIVTSQLKENGVQQENIEQVGGCTFRNSKLFYSYRRNGKNSGRHLAVIRPRQ